VTNVAHVRAEDAPGDAPDAASVPVLALAAAREAQKLSLADIANRLKLSVSQVEALEKGEYDRLPGPVFVRGFTRNYARLLKLDPDEAIRAVEARLPQSAPTDPARKAEANIPMPDERTRPWPAMIGLIALVFLGAALFETLWPEAPPQETRVAPVATPTLATVPAAATVEVAPSSAPPASDSPPRETAAAESGAAEPAVKQVAAAAPGERVLHFVFDQRSWVQVRDASGKVVFEQLNPAGTTHDIAARAPLSLVIGNAQGVRLTDGDRAVDLAPHIHVDVARLTIE
jgi:cytoskeleton protein RodZ